MLNYFLYSISITFSSWIIGMLFYAPIRYKDFHKHSLENFNFLPSKPLNTFIGLDVFKWIVRNTFFKFFNPKLNLRLKRRIELKDLRNLRLEMISAEISHLIAFVLVCIAAVVVGLVYSWQFGVVLMLVNIVLNLYPALLQQQNKRRIDRFINLK